MKLLFLEIETAPHLATVWSLWQTTVAINQLLDTSRVMCYSAMWLDNPNKIIFDSEYNTDHDKMIKGLHALLDEADAVVTYNGNSFDLPTINKEFLFYHLTPPSPYHKIDLYQEVKKTFRFASNKLDHISQELGLGQKEKHQGHQLWLDCMNGKREAWRTMEKYNKQDVDYFHSIFTSVCRHPHLVEPGLVGNFEKASADELHRAVWPLVGAALDREIDEAVERFRDRQPSGRADDDIRAVAAAVVQGRVSDLLVLHGRQVWGIVDRSTGELRLQERQEGSSESDVLDDLAEMTWVRGGRVLVAQPQKMPTGSPVAAIYRY